MYCILIFYFIIILNLQNDSFIIRKINNNTNRSFILKKNNIKKLNMILVEDDNDDKKNYKYNLDIDLYEVSINYDIKLINLELIDSNKPFYMILGYKDYHSYVLIQDMKEKSFCGIFIDRNSFSYNDLNSIYKKYINDKKYLNKIWIFNDNKFIGSIDEFYKDIL